METRKETNKLSLFKFLFAAATSVGVLFTLCFYNMRLGANVFLMSFAVMLLTYFALKKVKDFVPGFYFAGSFAILLLASKYMLSLNSLYRGFNIIVMLAVYFYTLELSLSRGDCTVKSITSLFFKPFAHLNAYVVCFFSLLCGKKDGKSKLGEILAGLLISAALLCVIVPLMLSADAAFSRILHGFFIGETFFSVLFECLYFIISASYGFAVISVCYMKSSLIERPRLFDREKEDENAVKAENTANAYTLPSMENGEKSFFVKKECISFVTIKTVLYIVGAVYLLFVAVQYAGMFSGAVISEEEYAQYARSGCFNLWFLTVLNLLIVLVSLRLTDGRQLRPDVSLKGIFCVYGIVNLMMIFSAFRKMYLYYERFGLTRLRLIVFVFLGVQFVCVLLLFVRLLYKKFELSRCVFALMLCAYCVLSCLNTDKLIAEHNIGLFETSGEVDASYLVYELSDDAYECVRNFVEQRIAEEQKNNSSNELEEYYGYRYHLNSKKTGYKKHVSWQEFNLTEFKILHSEF